MGRLSACTSGEAHPRRTPSAAGWRAVTAIGSMRCGSPEQCVVSSVALGGAPGVGSPPCITGGGRIVAVLRWSGRGLTVPTGHSPSQITVSHDMGWDELSQVAKKVRKLPYGCFSSCAA